ncbi:MAG: nuclear transport factor 2 family protein [Isosphaeraceae bacterium]|nr:nuclear transport factor 2 family protein [Isosphaeraceae bacterium]
MELELEIRRQREVLLNAVNAHDLDTIRALVDPSYEGKNEAGTVVIKHDKAIDYAAGLFRKHPEYREVLEIEDLQIAGNIARLTTRRIERYTGIFGMARTRDARQVETWLQREGRWVLAEERVLNEGTDGGGVVVPWWMWC